MIYGPRINKSSKYNDVLGEDQLGIKYVAINISDILQNGVTSVTPRARYWSFYTWILYDFVKYSGMKKTEGNLKSYIKRQEWYFILANISYGQIVSDDSYALQGKREGTNIWNNDGQVLFLNDKYIQNPYGGYGIYRNVLKILGLTCDSDKDNDIEIDRLTKTGEQVALAFESEIINTEYYKKYRLSNVPVPRNVIIEYGHKVHLSHIGKTADGKRLIDLFIPNDNSSEQAHIRMLSLQYYRYILNKYNIKSMTDNEWRRTFYDSFSVKVNDSIIIPDEYKQVAAGWEICVTRMYFTFALEGIFARILRKLSDSPVDILTLIKKVLSDIEFNVLNKKVSEFIRNEVILEADRNFIIENLRLNNEQTILSGLRLGFDVYNRMVNRKDFDDFHYDLLKIGGMDQISLQYWIDIVESYKEKKVEELLIYVLQHLCINQHLKTALEKLYTTRNNTFHYVYEDGILHFVDFDKPEFNVMRVVQGTSILADLDLI